MAVLDPTNRQRTAIAITREDLGPATWTKADLQAAVAAADDWIEANFAAYSQALPQPFRNATTAPQKAQVLAFVVMRRVGRLRIAEDG